MENPNDKDLQHLDKYLERLMQRQDEIDKKAKDAQNKMNLAIENDQIKISFI